MPSRQPFFARDLRDAHDFLHLAMVVNAFDDSGGYEDAVALWSIFSLHLDPCSWCVPCCWAFSACAISDLPRTGLTHARALLRTSLAQR